MPDFEMTFRRTSALQNKTVTADTRELAISSLLAAAPDDETVEVLQTVEVLSTPPAESPSASEHHSTRSAHKK